MHRLLFAVSLLTPTLASGGPSTEEMRYEWRNDWSAAPVEFADLPKISDEAERTARAAATQCVEQAVGMGGCQPELLAYDDVLKHIVESAIGRLDRTDDPVARRFGLAAGWRRHAMRSHPESLHQLARIGLSAKDAAAVGSAGKATLSLAAEGAPGFGEQNIALLVETLLARPRYHALTGDPARAARVAKFHAEKVGGRLGDRILLEMQPHIAGWEDGGASR
ncbi:MAG: hypothetical protein AB8H79_07515 [Myxococcota bacterium]